MFAKNLRYAYLLDFYGSLLDEHTLKVMQSYYDDDLSLAEVALGMDISRQGVRHIIKRGEEQLDFYEKNLALAKRHEENLAIQEGLADITARMRRGEQVDPDEIDRLTDLFIKNN